MNIESSNLWEKTVYLFIKMGIQYVTNEILVKKHMKLDNTYIV